MDNSSQLEELSEFLSPVSEDSPCGQDLENDDEYQRIEREVGKASESREWSALKKDIQKLLLETKDLRVVARFSQTLLHTEKLGVNGLIQGLCLTREYIDKYWGGVYPSEDTEDPDERYAERINAIADMGGWVSAVLPLKKKSSLLSFSGMDDYYLDDLIAFQNGDVVEGKQPVKEIIGSLSSEEITQIDDALASFSLALDLAEENKKLISEKTQITFIDFDSYLIPCLKEGILILKDLSPNALEMESSEEEDTYLDSNTSKNVGSIKNRNDVVKSLEMICDYYAVNEPSSPLPLLLMRAKSIVHKDFLEVLEELVPDSVSMTEAVFGRKDDENS